MVKGEKSMTTKNRVPVYDVDQYGERHVVARVNYNQRLDYWDGHNWTSGSTGRHLGITKLRDGRYVLIHGTQWQGESDYGEVVTNQEALDAIMRTGHQDLLKDAIFRPLAALIDATHEQSEEDIAEINIIKTLRRSGSSITATISPSELSALNVTAGDTVAITLRRL